MKVRQIKRNYTTSIRQNPLTKKYGVLEFPEIFDNFKFSGVVKGLGEVTGSRFVSEQSFPGLNVRVDSFKDLSYRRNALGFAFRKWSERLFIIALEEFQDKAGNEKFAIIGPAPNNYNLDDYPNGVQLESRYPRIKDPLVYSDVTVTVTVNSLTFHFH